MGELARCRIPSARGWRRVQRQECEHYEEGRIVRIVVVKRREGGGSELQERSMLDHDAPQMSLEACFGPYWRR